MTVIGIEYLPGGVASGFHHVTRDDFGTRLLQLKGKRTVRSQQVREYEVPYSIGIRTVIMTTYLYTYYAVCISA